MRQIISKAVNSAGSYEKLLQAHKGGRGNAQIGHGLPRQPVRNSIQRAR